jgi:hypothetical protein
MSEDLVDALALYLTENAKPALLDALKDPKVASWLDSQFKELVSKFIFSRGKELQRDFLQFVSLEATERAGRSEELPQSSDLASALPTLSPISLSLGPQPAAEVPHLSSNGEHLV